MQKKVNGVMLRGMKGMIKRGKTLNEIAEKYEISHATIYYHIPRDEMAELRSAKH
jgi:DNA-binding CsgD family transcriptional regulator